MKNLMLALSILASFLSSAQALEAAYQDHLSNVIAISDDRIYWKSYGMKAFEEIDTKVLRGDINSGHFVFMDYSKLPYRQGQIFLTENEINLYSGSSKQYYFRLGPYETKQLEKFELKRIPSTRKMIFAARRDNGQYIVVTDAKYSMTHNEQVFIGTPGNMKQQEVGPILRTQIGIVITPQDGRGQIVFLDLPNNKNAFWFKKKYRTSAYKDPNRDPKNITSASLNPPDEAEVLQQLNISPTFSSLFKIEGLEVVEPLSTPLL